MQQSPPKNWQKTIWREWKYTTDIDYGEHLFALVGDEPVGWGSKITYILFNAIAGVTIFILLTFAITSKWSILQHALWAGAVTGAFSGYLAGRGLLWGKWLNRLESNTPTGDTLGRLILGGTIVACCGGMVFGPLVWLSLAGLFWLAGEVIYWINRGLTESYTFNAEDRHLLFWWRGRPHIFETIAILKNACETSPEIHAFWADPLRQVENYPADTPENLIDKLLSSDWVERLAARNKLVELGPISEPTLRAIAEMNQPSPLQNTVRQLLEDVERLPSQR